jgi:hypothetical protein
MLAIPLTSFKDKALEELIKLVEQVGAGRLGVPAALLRHSPRPNPLIA